MCRRSRTTIRFCGAIVLMLVALAGCARHDEWITFRGEGGRGHSRNAMTPPLGVRWELSLQTGGPRSFAFNNLIVKDDTLYFGSTDGNFYAMSIDTGYMDWVFRTGAAVNSVPHADETRVYFGSNDGNVYALDRESGEEIWRFDAGRRIQSTVIGYGDTIIFSADGGGLWFLSRDGELEHVHPNPVWHRVTLQVMDGEMYMVPGPTETPRTLGVYDVDEHAHGWLLPNEIMSALWYSFPAVTRTHMIMQTSRITDSGAEFNTYALDRSTGAIDWVRRFAGDFSAHPPDRSMHAWMRDQTRVLDFQAPAVWRDRVISASGDTIVRALDERTGAVDWERYLSRRTSSAPMVSGDHVYVGVFGDAADAQTADSEGTRPPRLLALSARSGRTVWELETNGAILSPPVVAGRYMVFGTDENYVYVLERVL
ncbi:MAG TPA: PQQ-binding-like beta-propeller repeat protein [Spirochaetia bacterium]|nr:PQQ-binding-like beta-propeller repeat protein [Spirochaetia bacterium]